MSIKPNVTMNRTGNTVNFSVKNRNGRRVIVYRSSNHSSELSFLTSYEVDDFQDIGSPLRASYAFSFEDLNKSLNTLQDNSNAVPPWYLIEPISPATFTVSNYQINPSWQLTAVTINTVIVGNLQAGAKSIRGYT